MTEDQEQQRLSDILSRDDTICFLADVPDEIHPDIRWSVYGAVVTNEVIVTAQAGTVIVLRAVPSEVLIPGMADRVYGMDITDQETAARLSDEIWEEQGDHLLQAISQ